MNQVFNAGLAYHDFRQIRKAYYLAATTAFLMSSYFVVGYLAGSLEVWNWGVSEWLNGIVAIGLTGSMTAFQFILYARGDISAGKASTIAAVIVAAGFSLLSEVGQGVERDHIRMETKSIESPTYQAIVNQLGNARQTQHPYSARLEQAEIKLVRCNEKLSAGIYRDCHDSQARVNAVEKQIQQYYQQSQSKQLALAGLAKDLERDENNYHPLVNFLRNIFGMAAISASFLLSLIIISFFEYAFHYLGGRYSRAKSYLLDNGFDVTTKERINPLPVQQIGENLLRNDGVLECNDGVLNRPESVLERTDKPYSDRARTVSEAFQAECDKIYPHWVTLIRAGDIKPTIRPARQFISNKLCSQFKPETLTPKQIDSVVNEWLEQATRDHVIMLNPEQGIGKSKYVLS